MNKTTTPRITIGMLRGACKEQRDIFRKEWPEGAEVSVENAFRAQELGLNLVWGEQWFTADARKAYDAARVPALKAYDEAIAQAWKAHREATAPALKAYDAAVAQGRKAHREALAQAWVVAYLQSVAEREVATAAPDGMHRPAGFQLRGGSDA